MGLFFASALQHHPFGTRPQAVPDRGGADRHQLFQIWNPGDLILVNMCIRDHALGPSHFAGSLKLSWDSTKQHEAACALQ